MEALVVAGDVAGVKAFFAESKQQGEEEEMLVAAVERAVRERAISLAADAGGGGDRLLRSAGHLLDTAITLAVEGLAPKTIPVAMMQDLFELSCLPSCKLLFSLLEERMLAFKQPPLGDASQALVLRLCNDILRRLSRCVETSFSGRILFFLSRFLPLSDKSALNVMGHFNTTNVTKYDTFQSEGAELVGHEDIDAVDSKQNKESNIPVDHSLYTKFWQMQQFFCNPNSCYEKVNWKLLQRDANEVLNVLASYKLERSAAEDDEAPHSKRRKQEQRTRKEQDDYYFAKYLTNPKLLHLQLNDSQFRRYFLTQCLIFFQYLLADTKFKNKQQVLSDDDKRFVKESSEKALKLLRETHPRGAHMADSVAAMTEREARWSEWKNNGCPELAPPSAAHPVKHFKKRARTKFNSAETDLGSPQLTKLWQIEPDIMKACRSLKRKFAPELKEFLQGPLEEMDPEQEVEEEYKSVNRSSFQWRAARVLLSSNALYICKSSNNITQTMPSFLESAILAAAKQIPELAEDVVKAERKQKKSGEKEGNEEVKEEAKAEESKA